MDTNEHVKALALDPGVPIRTISFEDALTRSREGKATTWIHILNTDNVETIRVLTEDFEFHPLAIADAVSEEERPALKEFDDDVFLVAPGIVRDQDGEEVYTEIAFFVRGAMLVSVCRDHVPSMMRTLDRWCKLSAPVNAEVGYLLYALLDGILDDFFPRLDQLEDEIDLIGDDIFAGNVRSPKDLVLIKRRMLQMRRRLGPFRDVLNSLLRRESSFITNRLEPYYYDLFGNALRLIELVDTNRDALNGLVDIHLSTISNRLNEVMKKMTVISTVLMTGALIAGIYGMNFKFMPELDWRFGYPFALGLMVVASLGILALFRKKGWL